jgi:hypothetical protein
MQGDAQMLAVTDFFYVFSFVCGATNLWGREHKVVCKSFVSMAYTCDHVLELVIRCIYYGSRASYAFLLNFGVPFYVLCDCLFLADSRSYQISHLILVKRCIISMDRM